MIQTDLMYRRPSERELELMGMSETEHIVQHMLAGVDLPLVRKHMHASPNRFPTIEIAGVGMRVGKTTLLEVVAGIFERRGLCVEKSYEEWWLNESLKATYDPTNPVSLSGVLLQSQKWFAEHKHGQLLQRNGHAVHIQEVTPEMDHNYALTNLLLGKLSREDFESYRTFYQSLSWDELSAPDLYIYVAASEEVYLERVQKSLRDFEKQDEFNPEYFLVQRAVNQLWLKRALRAKKRVLVVDSGQVDYSIEGEGRELVVQQIIGALCEQGWELNHTHKGGNSG